MAVDISNLDMDENNDFVHSINFMAELVSAQNEVRDAFNNIDNITNLCKLYSVEKSDSVKTVGSCIYPSLEIGIIGIAGSIIKGIYLACRWILRTIASIVKFIVDLFRDDISDAKKMISEIAERIRLMQEENIAIGYKLSEAKKIKEIITMHIHQLDKNLPVTGGMRFNEFRDQWIDDFNSNMPDGSAKVDSDGTLRVRIKPHKGYKLRDLEYFTADKISEAGDNIQTAIDALKTKRDEIRRLGNPIKRIMDECESINEKEALKMAKGNGPGVADAYCKCAIIGHDLHMVRFAMTTYIKMVKSIKKKAKEYVEANV